jgi:hypothetical protein
MFSISYLSITKEVGMKLLITVPLRVSILESGFYIGGFKLFDFLYIITLFSGVVIFGAITISLKFFLIIPVHISKTK